MNKEVEIEEVTSYHVNGVSFETRDAAVRYAHAQELLSEFRENGEYRDYDEEDFADWILANYSLHKVG